MDSNDIRTATKSDGTIWFCLGDLLKAMASRTEANKAKLSLEEGLGDDTLIKLSIADALDREQETLFVSEHGAMFLLSRSR